MEDDLNKNINSKYNIEKYSSNLFIPSLLDYINNIRPFCKSFINIDRSINEYPSDIERNYINVLDISTKFNVYYSSDLLDSLNKSINDYLIYSFGKENNKDLRLDYIKNLNNLIKDLKSLKTSLFLPLKKSCNALYIINDQSIKDNLNNTFISLFYSYLLISDSIKYYLNRFNNLLDIFNKVNQALLLNEKMNGVL